MIIKNKHTVKLFPLFFGMIFLLCPALFLSGCDNPAAFSSASARDSEFTKIFEENAKALENDLDSLVQEAEASSLHKHSDHIKLTAADPGYDIFIPSTGLFNDYRYGPSIMLQDDGSIDAWFSAPGGNEGELDWITYRHSDDGGATWTDEKAVLYPTPGSADELSVCDPDVFFYEGYYYLGYTSTIDETHDGLCNSVFLARSTSPDGPFEKWNGEGYGGDPVPVIYYDGLSVGWGTGEPSFVVVGTTLFVYSTKDSYSATFQRVRVTEVRCADLTDPGWPGKLEFMGYGVIRTDTGAHEETDYIYSDCDSWDVAYIEEAEKFVAVCTNNRFTSESSILYFESLNGIYFERVSEINTNIFSHSHNCGLMSDKNGHIKKGDPLLLGYAYGGPSDWGIWSRVWSTRFVPLNLELTDTVDRSEEKIKPSTGQISRQKPDYEGPIAVSSENLIYRTAPGDPPIEIKAFWTDLRHIKHDIDKKDLILSNYDPEIISVNEGEITAKNPGRTCITIGYQGLARNICVCVLDGENKSGSEIDHFYPIVREYKLSLYQPYIIQLRPFAVLKDYSLYELDNMGIVNYGVTFTSENPDVCQVVTDGTLVPLSLGTSNIRIESASGVYIDILVNIVP